MSALRFSYLTRSALFVAVEPALRLAPEVSGRHHLLQQRRGKMYDPNIVDTFIRAYERIMPETESIAPRSR
jgi:hypothetical protein